MNSCRPFTENTLIWITMVSSTESQQRHFRTEGRARDHSIWCPVLYIRTCPGSFTKSKQAVVTIIECNTEELSGCSEKDHFTYGVFKKSPAGSARFEWAEGLTLGACGACSSLFGIVVLCIVFVAVCSVFIYSIVTFSSLGVYDMTHISLSVAGNSASMVEF